MEAAGDRGRRAVPASPPLSTNPPRPIRVIYTVVGRAPLRDKHVGAAAFASGGAPVDARKSPEIAAPAPSKKRASCGLLLAPGTGDSTTVYVAGRRLNSSSRNRQDTVDLHALVERVRGEFKRNAGAAAHSGAGGASVGAGTADVRRGPQPSRCRVVPALVVRHRRPAGLLRRLPRQPSQTNLSAERKDPTPLQDVSQAFRAIRGNPQGRAMHGQGAALQDRARFFYRRTSNIRENLITNERSVRCGRSKRS